MSFRTESVPRINENPPLSWPRGAGSLGGQPGRRWRGVITTIAKLPARRRPLKRAMSGRDDVQVPDGGTLSGLEMEASYGHGAYCGCCGPVKSPFSPRSRGGPDHRDATPARNPICPFAGLSAFIRRAAHMQPRCSVSNYPQVEEGRAPPRSACRVQRRLWFLSHGRHGRTVSPPSSEPDSRACTSTSTSSPKIVMIVLGLMAIGDCIPNVAASVVESEKTSLISEV